MFPVEIVEMQWAAVRLPGSVRGVLWGWTLFHQGGHFNVKIFGNILYVGLSEAHSA